MNLRKTSLVTLALTGMYLFITISFVSYFIVLQGHIQLEKQFIETDIDRAKNALNAEIDRIDVLVRDWAYWEDTCKFINDRNQKFIDENLTSTGPLNQLNTIIVFLDGEGNIVYSRGPDPVMDDPFRLPEELQSLFTHDAPLVQDTGYSGVRGIVALKDGLFLVAARPVRAGRESDNCRGYLLTGRYLDDKVEETISIRTRLDVSILSLAEHGEAIRSQVPELSASYPFAARFALEGRAEAYLLINDIWGDPVGALNLRMPRDIYNRGILTLNYLSISIGIIFLVLFIIFFYLLDAKILMRITYIADQVQVIGSLRDHSQRVVLSGDDELTGLASNINMMLSELEDVSAELSESNATKDRFFSIIAHDLKGPFISLKSSSSLIREALEDNDGEQINIVLHELDTVTHNAFNLLNNLLEWSRLQTHTIRVEPEPVNIRLIMDKSIFLFAEKFRSKQLSVENNVPKELHAWVDYNMLDVVLRNLVSNAVKFTPRGGEITLAGRERQNRIEIVIEDTGIGIDPANMKKLFKIDAEFSRPGTEGEKGTGFGLVLCMDFIKANGGSIEVSSEPARGSKFIINLPKP